MAFKFTKNIKVGVPCTDGELIFEIKRPTKEEQNKYLAEQIGLKSEGVDRLNEIDAIRISMFDKLVERVYMLTRDGKEEPVEGEDGTAMGPKDFPTSIKADIILRVLDQNRFSVKNL